jgi:hypothetical protein
VLVLPGCADHRASRPHARELRPPYSAGLMPALPRRP